MARKRELQRRSGLLTRIPMQVRATLGDALWTDFVAHASACYEDACYEEDAFLSAFPQPVLHCVGPQHGGTGPHNFCADLTCARAYATLGELHLDHEQDLVVTSDMWVRALARPPRATARYCATCSSWCCRCGGTTAWKMYRGFRLASFSQLGVRRGGTGRSPFHLPPATSSELSAKTQISSRGAPRSPL